MIKIIPAERIYMATAEDRNLVKLLAEGKRNEEIGQILAISRRTIEGQLSNLKRKTEAKTLPELVAIFMRNKLIE